MVFELMRINQLYAKRSKCAFATSRVEYRGHLIEEKGVSVLEWPVPKNLKALRGFIGLAGYYRRYVKDFGVIARPLTALTNKNAFVWHDEA